MENLKVKASSEAESKEVQELFFELGYEKGVCSTGAYQALIVATPESRFQKTPYSSRATSLNHEAHSQYKEITIQELRDLVVLKRNDVGDATHESHCGELKFILLGDWWNLFTGGKWQQFSHKQSPRCNKLKPIEKPMKEPKQAEFLVKTDSGYVLQVLDENAGGADVVRIPDGAEIAVKSNRGYIEFRKGASFYAEEWCEGSWHVNDFPKREWDIVWKRETLNDQVASAEVARQESKEWDLGDYDFAESDALIESNVEHSSIVKTLAERQSTYGDFSKVAEMTQGLLFVMSQYGYSDMPDTHKESIHMIASKLARIVNGDNNHLDSWHDIGGYSKLIENLIKSAND